MLTWRRLAMVYVIGALAASVGDAFHVHTHTTFYPPDRFVWYLKGIPFWIPFLFGTASAAFAIAYELGKTVLGKEHFRGGVPIRYVFIAGLVYMGCHCLSGYIFRWGLPLTHVLLGLAVLLTWVSVDRSWGGALTCVLAGVAGVAAEILLVRKGIFSFSEQANQLYGVATWLPWIYMAGGLAVGRFVESAGSPNEKGVAHGHEGASTQASRDLLEKKHCLRYNGQEQVPLPQAGP